MLSEHVGLSARRFTRLFTLEVGLTPKLYARIKRFERMLRLHAGRRCADWSEVAQHCGYFDQSHLIRDCKSLSGFTPSELVRDAAATRPRRRCAQLSIDLIQCARAAALASSRRSAEETVRSALEKTSHVSCSLASRIAKGAKQSRGDAIASVCTAVSSIEERKPVSPR